MVRCFRASMDFREWSRRRRLWAVDAPFPPRCRSHIASLSGPRNAWTSGARDRPIAGHKLRPPVGAALPPPHHHCCPQATTSDSPSESNHARARFIADSHLWPSKWKDSVGPGPRKPTRSTTCERDQSIRRWTSVFGDVVAYDLAVGVGIVVAFGVGFRSAFDLASGMALALALISGAVAGTSTTRSSTLKSATGSAVRTARFESRPMAVFMPATTDARPGESEIVGLCAIVDGDPGNGPPMGARGTLATTGESRRQFDHRLYFASGRQRQRDGLRRCALQDDEDRILGPTEMHGRQCCLHLGCRMSGRRAQVGDLPWAQLVTRPWISRQRTAADLQ